MPAPSAAHLDVEQQWRLAQERRAREAAAAAARTPPPPTAYVSWRYYDDARGVALAMMACTCAVAVAAVLAVTRARGRLATHWRHAQLASASSLFTARRFVLALFAYALLVCANGVLASMKWASEYRASAGLGGDAALPWHTSPAPYVFALECAGVAALLAHVLTAQPRQHGAGAAASLALLFPSMWQSLRLRAEEVERGAMWLTHGIFAVALYLLYATATPYLRHEYAEVKRALRAHTRHALDRERRGVHELLSHTRRRPRQHE